MARKNTNDEEKRVETTQDIDWGVVEGGNQDYLDIYPRIQWHHGKRQFSKVGGMSFQGGAFIPEDQFADLEAPGWEEDSFVPSSGGDKEITGFWNPKAELSIIRVKKYWTDDGSHTNAICCVKGVDGIFCFQTKGISKAAAFNSLFNQHRNQIVSMANRSKPLGAPSLEPFALWCVIVPDKHTMQPSAVKKNSESEVTPPTLYLPDKLTPEYVKSLWVGSDNYKRFVEIFKETEAWQTQIPQKSTQDKDNGNSGDNLSDAQLKEIIDICTRTDYPEHEIASKVSNGGTTKIELLTSKEADEAIAILKEV